MKRYWRLRGALLGALFEVPIPLHLSVPGALRAMATWFPPRRGSSVVIREEPTSSARASTSPTRRAGCECGCELRFTSSRRLCSPEPPQQPRRIRRCPLRGPDGRCFSAGRNDLTEGATSFDSMPTPCCDGPCVRTSLGQPGPAPSGASTGRRSLMPDNHPDRQKARRRSFGTLWNPTCRDLQDAESKRNLVTVPVVHRMRPMGRSQDDRTGPATRCPHRLRTSRAVLERRSPRSGLQKAALDGMTRDSGCRGAIRSGRNPRA